MIRTGGEVDAFCTRCELNLAHTIIAMVEGKPVKVECNTCHGVHRFRGSGGRSPGSSAARAALPSRARSAAVSFDAQLAANRGPSLPYSSKRTYAVHDVVDHPTFGRGFVSALRDGSKIEVTFRTDVKLLVHGRG